MEKDVSLDFYNVSTPLTDIKYLISILLLANHKLFMLGGVLEGTLKINGYITTWPLEIYFY